MDHSCLENEKTSSILCPRWARQAATGRAAYRGCLSPVSALRIYGVRSRWTHIPGGYPGDDEKGGELFGKGGSEQDDRKTPLASARWLKARPDCTGKIGVTGLLLRRRHRQYFSRADGSRSGCRSSLTTEGSGCRRRSERSRRPFSSITEPRTHGLLKHGRPTKQPSKAANVPHEGYLYPGAATASTTMRRLLVTTKPQQSRPGHAPSIGSISTCAAHRRRDLCSGGL